LRLYGRLLGGYIPSPGPLIQLQYHVVGFAGGWAPFDVPAHARSNGRWSATITMPQEAGGLTYLIRGLISAPQNGWPYTGAVTNVISRHVQAPAKARDAARDRRHARRHATTAAAQRATRRRRHARRRRGAANRRLVADRRAGRRDSIRMLSIGWLLDPANTP
jgi:hypothetical protein